MMMTHIAPVNRTYPARHAHYTHVGWGAWRTTERERAKERQRRLPLSGYENETPAIQVLSSRLHTAASEMMQRERQAWIIEFFNLEDADTL
jgi:hypothetical protein